MFAEARAELAAILAGVDGLQVHETTPDEVNPPCVIIQPADPALDLADDDTTYAGELTLRFELVVLVLLDEQTGNEAPTRQLDGLVDDTLAALKPSSWWPANVSQPGPFRTISWSSHGQLVTIHRHTDGL